MIGGGTLPLETLIMGEPDLLIVGRPYTPPSLAEQAVLHPALRPLAARAGGPATSDSDWVCGAPFAARAVEALAEARRALPARLAGLSAGPRE